MHIRKMIQNAFCFLPKAEKSDGQVQNGVQNPPSPKGESGGRGRRQMQPLENGAGGQQRHEKSQAAAEDVPRRSTTLVDQILNASRRLNFMHRSGESVNKHEVEPNDETSPVLFTGKKKLQAAKLVSRRSASVDTMSYDKQLLQGKSASVPSSRESSFLLNKTDERYSEKLSLPVRSNNMPDLEPVQQAGRQPLQFPNLVIPENFAARKTTRNRSDTGSDTLLCDQSSVSRFLENTQVYVEANSVADFSFHADSLPIQRAKAALAQNELGLDNHSSVPILEQEKADEYRVMQMILPSSPTSQPGDMNQRSPPRGPLAIEDKEEAEEEAEEKDSKVDDERNDHGIMRLAPISQPVVSQQGKTRLVHHRRSMSTTPDKNDEKNAHDSCGYGMLTAPNSAPTSRQNSRPNSPRRTKMAFDIVNYNDNVSPTTEKSEYQGIHFPSSTNENPDYQHNKVLYESFRTPSSLEDSETMARLWEELNPITSDPPATEPATQRQPPVVEEKLRVAPVPAADSSIRAHRRKVRFSGFQDACKISEGSRDLARDLAREPARDPSDTLLGKLSATKHQQVQYLQDELDQTRAQVAELELDCQAQRDLKLAFKVQAVRLGAALKKLREFAQENGLDPREADGKRVAPSSTVNARKGSKDTDSEARSHEMNASPELIRLRALRVQAKQFGWLCEPKEVELGERIGIGSTADIFKGVWHNLDVAVKCWRPETFGGNMDAIGSFCQEVELVSRPRHPYILHMFAVCLSPPDHPWIITEYLSSGTLAEWLHGTKSRERNRTSPLPPLPERLRIAIEVSMAMQYLHELSPKILHRDLKPSNILLDERNHVRISDFNCARCFDYESDAVMTGETGTYVYMAPEVMAHESYDEKCDIYSFAVILCELITGNPPYVDTCYSPAEIACKVAQGTLRPTLGESQPPALVQLIKSAWIQEPTERPSFSKITATLKVIAKNL